MNIISYKGQGGYYIKHKWVDKIVSTKKDVSFKRIVSRETWGDLSIILEKIICLSGHLGVSTVFRPLTHVK
jgi:hypothetical protein